LRKVSPLFGQVSSRVGIERPGWSPHSLRSDHALIFIIDSTFTSFPFCDKLSYQNTLQNRYLFSELIRS
jgi:hypothetical protein